MFSLTEEVGRYLFGLRQNESVVLIIEEQQLFFPNLVNLSRDDLSHFLFILVIKVVFLQLQYLGGQCLTKIEYGTTAKMLKRNFIGQLFTHFKIRVNFQCFRKCNLQIGVFQLIILNDGTIAPYLKVSLVGIDNNIIIFVCAVRF